MDGEPRHPTALTLFRVLLYLAVVLVLGVVGGGLFAFLGVVAALGGLDVLLTGGTNAAVVLLLAGGGVVVAAAVGLAVAVAARRVDARVTDADARPDPVDAVREWYVESDVDEADFERELAAALREKRAGPFEDAGAAGRRRTRGRTRERDRAER